MDENGSAMGLKPWHPLGNKIKIGGIYGGHPRKYGICRYFGYFKGLINLPIDHILPESFSFP